MSRRSRNSRAWRYVWGGIRRDADARALVLASEREDWSYDLLEVSECPPLSPEEKKGTTSKCDAAHIHSFSSFPSSAILIRRRTSHRWWSLLSPVLYLSPGSPTVAATPRLRPATTLACEAFTRSKTVTVERMTKVNSDCCTPWVHINNDFFSLRHFLHFFPEFDWVWDTNSRSTATLLSCENRKVSFHSEYSCGTAAVRGSKELAEGQHFWEIKMTSPVYGTDMVARDLRLNNRHIRLKPKAEKCQTHLLTENFPSAQMVGIGTSDVNLDKYRHTFCSLLGKDPDSWGLSYTGKIERCTLHVISTLSFMSVWG